MTKPMTFDQLLDAKDASRSKADDKAYAKLCRRMDEAEALVGHLNSGRFYINKRNNKGQLTGKEEYFTTKAAAVSYLLEKGYV